MFKKFTQSDGVATNTQAKSSVIRRITKNIVECYPSMEEKLPAMFPKKVPVYLTKCKDNNVTMVVCQNIPWFFQHRKDDFVPTLHMLHRFPDLLPKVKVDRGQS